MGFAVCVAALLFAVFYLQNTLQLDPCPLCIVDRVIFIGMGIIFLIAAIHNPARRGQRIYGLVNVALAISGIVVGGRHVWLQHYPATTFQECGASLSYMFGNFPLPEAFRMVFSGTGECTSIEWTLLGMTIPEQTLLLFIVLLLLILWQSFRRQAL